MKLTGLFMKLENVSENRKNTLSKNCYKFLQNNNINRDLICCKLKICVVFVEYTLCYFKGFHVI